MKSERKESSVHVSVWGPILLWMSDLRTTAAHTAAVLNLSSTNVSCHLGGFSFSLSHICDIAATLLFRGKNTSQTWDLDALAWLKSDQTELGWTNTQISWMGVGLLLPVFTFVLGRFPTVDFEQKLGKKKKKKGNRRRGRYHNRKETTWRTRHF